MPGIMRQIIRSYQPHRNHNATDPLQGYNRQRVVNNCFLFLLIKMKMERTMEKIKLEDILKILEQFEKSSIDSLRYKTGEEEIELSRHKNGGSDTANIQGANLE